MEDKNKKAHSEEYLGEARDFWWNDDYIELLAKRLELGSCSTLVDVGCGLGYMGYKLYPYLKHGGRVLGFDREPRYVELAAQKSTTIKNDNAISFVFREGDANAIPLEDNISDITLCQTVLIHMADPAKTIREMLRVTRPGGLVVAFEPNNLTNALVADSLTSDDIEERLIDVEAQLRIQKGKKELGEGYNSLGDFVPQLFNEAGLRDINVWMADKPMDIIPPYDSIQYKLRVQELLGWLEEGQSSYDYEQELRYYKAGGGTEEDFRVYWEKLRRDTVRLKESLEAETYTNAGGSVMYIVAGRKQI